jgi:hypothetical protein
VSVVAQPVAEQRHHVEARAFGLEVSMQDLIDVGVAMSVGSPHPGSDTRPAEIARRAPALLCNERPRQRSAPPCSARTAGRRPAAECNPACPLCVWTDAFDRARVKRRRRANYRVNPRANKDLDEHLNTSAKSPSGQQPAGCCSGRRLGRSGRPVSTSERGSGCRLAVKRFAFGPAGRRFGDGGGEHLLGGSGVGAGPDGSGMVTVQCA